MMEIAATVFKLHFGIVEHGYGDESHLGNARLIHITTTIAAAA